MLLKHQLYGSCFEIMKNDIYPSTIGKNTTKRLSKFYLAVFLVFYSQFTAYAEEFKCDPHLAFDSLPELVVKTGQDIVKAANSGDMQLMLQVAEQNEVWPVADFGPDADYEQPPTISWQQQSQNTDGLYVLAQMVEILKLPFAKKNLIGDIDLYIWPYFATQDMKSLCTATKLDLLKISTPEEYHKMLKNGQYTGFQLAIGSDGSWHYFARKNLKATNK